MEPIPALKRFIPLVGSWKTTLRWSPATHKLVGGPTEVAGVTRFSWLEGGRFLLQSFGTSSWVIGCDVDAERYVALYADGRGSSRIYEVSLARGLWKVWRRAPHFSQQFEGRFRDAASRIEASWERSTDGRRWLHDFDLTYQRMSRGSEAA